MLLRNKHLHKVNISDGTEEWRQLRLAGLDLHPGGIGGSEASAIFGVHSYLSPVVLWNQKIGRYVPRLIITPELLAGILREPGLRKMWRSYDGTREWAENFYHGIKLRKNKTIKKPIYNDKFPHFLINYDSIIMPGEKKLHRYENGKCFISDEILEGYAPLEIKTANSWTAKKFKDTGGVPPEYYFQTCAQMIVLEAEYGEILINEDKSIEVYPVELNAEVRDMLNDGCSEFWNSILKGRELFKLSEKAKYAARIDEFKEIQSEIDSLEPSPVGMLSEENFIKESWYLAQEFDVGDKKTYNSFKQYTALKEVIRILSSESNYYKNVLQNDLRHRKVGKVRFPYHEDTLSDRLKEVESYSFREQTRGDKPVNYFITNDNAPLSDYQEIVQTVNEYISSKIENIDNA